MEYHHADGVYIYIYMIYGLHGHDKCHARPQLGEAPKLELTTGLMLQHGGFHVKGVALNQPF